MPPHGPGMIGATHSHDPGKVREINNGHSVASILHHGLICSLFVTSVEYPDDMWNLYTQLEPETTTGNSLNAPFILN